MDKLREEYNWKCGQMTDILKSKYCISNASYLDFCYSDASPRAKNYLTTEIEYPIKLSLSKVMQVMQPSSQIQNSRDWSITYIIIIFSDIHKFQIKIYHSESICSGDYILNSIWSISFSKTLRVCQITLIIIKIFPINTQ